MAARQQWRIWCVNELRNASQIRIVEFQFRETAGVSQTFSGGTVSASDEFSATYSATKAGDNSTSTSWRTDIDVTDAWWAYDYGSGVTKDIVEVTIRIETNGQPYAPTQFTLASYNGTSWDDIATQTLINGWDSADTKTFTFPFPVNAELSQVAVEVGGSFDGDAASISQVVAEAAKGESYAEYSQAVLEAAKGESYAQYSQCVLEVLYQRIPLTPSSQPFIWIMA